MLRMKPHCTIFTRPARSASPPMTTMKMPENSAVIDTAMFITLIWTPRSAAMVGAMFSVVWAKSQKASTPRMMPKRSRSLPTHLVFVSVVSVVNVGTRSPPVASVRRRILGPFCGTCPPHKWHGGLRQPGQGGDHDRRGSRLQRGLDDRCKVRRVIGRNVTGKRPRRLRLMPLLGIDATKRPVGVRSTECIRDPAEVLTGRLTRGRERLVAKVVLEGRRNRCRHLRIVGGERILVVELELGIFRRAGSHAFAPYDALDGLDQQGTRAIAISAD